MGRVEKILLGAVLMALALLLLLTFYQSEAAQDEARAYYVSVLVKSPSERFRRGAEQAALDFGADVHFVSGYDTATQQRQYLQRELDNAADAIVLLSEDPADTGEFLEEKRTRVPVVTVAQRLLSTQAAAHVGVDDGALGERVAAELMAYGETDCLLFYTENAQPSLAEQRSGLERALQSRGIGYRILQVSETGRGVEAALNVHSGQAIVTLEPVLLSALCEHKKAEDAVYGAGFRTADRPLLETGAVRSLVVYSEYDMGYLSVREAVRAAEGKIVGGAVLESYIADARNMYESPVAEILFPIG